jgi:hypothetical protein
MTTAARLSGSDPWVRLRGRACWHHEHCRVGGRQDECADSAHRSSPAQSSVSTARSPFWLPSSAAPIRLRNAVASLLCVRQSVERTAAVQFSHHAPADPSIGSDGVGVVVLMIHAPRVRLGCDRLRYLRFLSGTHRSGWRRANRHESFRLGRYPVSAGTVILEGFADSCPDPGGNHAVDGRSKRAK